jgi:hypothetical protein
VEGLNGNYYREFKIKQEFKPISFTPQQLKASANLAHFVFVATVFNHLLYSEAVPELLNVSKVSGADTSPNTPPDSVFVTHEAICSRTNDYGFT